MGAGKFRHPRKSSGPIMWMADLSDLYCIRFTRMLCSCITLGFCNSVDPDSDPDDLNTVLPDSGVHASLLKSSGKSCLIAATFC
jgi:hypothetical protein